MWCYMLGDNSAAARLYGACEDHFVFSNTYPGIHWLCRRRANGRCYADKSLPWRWCTEAPPAVPRPQPPSERVGRARSHSDLRLDNNTRVQQKMTRARSQSSNAFWGVGQTVADVEVSRESRRDYGV